MLYENIKKLVQYGVETGLTPACEKNYTINLLWMSLKKTNMWNLRKSTGISILKRY